MAERSTAVAKAQESYLDSFTAAVMKQFGTLAPSIEFSPYQRRLANHLALKVDSSLKTLEVKRQWNSSKKNDPPIVWENVNLEKMAVDAVDRIDLGLDALIPNHIHVIPYLNGRTKKYDLDLRVGYAGKDHYYRKMAVDEPLNVIYELVCETDYFVPKKKSIHNDVESYEFEIKQPFKRGAVIGGFGYIVYADPKKNKLILVSDEEFEKSRMKGNKEFWGTENEPGVWKDRMQYKTIVTRTVTKLALDPEKIGRAFMNVQAQEEAADAAMVGAGIDEHANKGEVIDISTKQPAAQGTEEQQPSPADDTPDPFDKYKSGLENVTDFETLNAVLKEAKADGTVSEEGRKVLSETYKAAAKKLINAAKIGTAGKVEEPKKEPEKQAEEAGPGW